MKRSQLARPTLAKIAAWKARSKPLQPRSKKRAKLYREGRAPFVVALLEAAPSCQFKEVHPWGIRFCAAPSVDVHEPLTRARGGSIVDPANAIALCRDHHNFIHNHPSWSLEHGYLRRKEGSND